MGPSSAPFAHLVPTMLPTITIHHPANCYDDWCHRRHPHLSPGTCTEASTARLSVSNVALSTVRL